MKRALGALVVTLSCVALAQAPSGTVEVEADSCKLYLPQPEARGASRIRWSGNCDGGLAEGRGVVRVYSGGRISLAAERTFSKGAATSAGESYSLRGGHAVRSRGADSLQVAPSELPAWALEFSMLVDERPARPAPPPAAKPKPAPAEVHKQQAEAKAAADKREAERQEAEKARVAAEAKAATEKREAEKSAQEAERRRLEAEKQRAEAQAAAERAAMAERQEKERAEKERAAAEAKAAAERAAASEKAAREAQAKAAVEKAEADKAAKAAAEKDAAARATLSVSGRGFADGGSGAPLRAVVTFKLTTPEGRDLGIATFVAGKGEDEIRQNAEALATVYEKASPFKAKLLDTPQVGPVCGGPGYVVEARITYPSAKSYGWYAGCMGEDLEQAGTRMRQLEEQLHRDFKVSPSSFWAYQYLIVGYVAEAGFRGRAEYASVAQPGLMAPGRVLVLPSSRQWSECTAMVNADPKLKDKAACLREAVAKLRSSLSQR